MRFVRQHPNGCFGFERAKYWPLSAQLRKVRKSLCAQTKRSCSDFLAVELGLVFLDQLLLDVRWNGLVLSKFCCVHCSPLRH